MWKHRPPSQAVERPPVTDVERARQRTMNRAVRLLAAKHRSIAELRERLLDKTWTDEKIVESVIEKLREYKYLDDDQFARDSAQSQIRRKPQGKRLLMQSMSQKKLDAETVKAAVDAAFETLPEEKLIDIAIEKRLRLNGRPETREATRKFIDHLLRRGFDFGLIRQKLSQITTDRFDENDAA